MAKSGWMRMAVAVLGDRLVQLPLLAQGLAEVVVEGGVVGLDADGGAVLGDRLIQLPLHKQGEAEAEMRVGVVGPACGRPRDWPPRPPPGSQPLPASGPGSAAPLPRQPRCRPLSGRSRLRSSKIAISSSRSPLAPAHGPARGPSRGGATGPPCSSGSPHPAVASFSSDRARS